MVTGELLTCKISFSASNLYSIEDFFISEAAQLKYLYSSYVLCDSLADNTNFPKINLLFKVLAF